MQGSILYLNSRHAMDQSHQWDLPYGEENLKLFINLGVSYFCGTGFFSPSQIRGVKTILFAGLKST